MGMIPHLLEFQEKYEEAGLVILALSGEGEALLEGFAAQQGITYPIGFGDRSGGAYGVSGIPDSYLVGADGTVVYQGHPSGINRGMLEAELAKVRFFPVLPEGFEAVMKAGERFDYAKAMKELDKILKKSEDEAEIATAEETKAYIAEKGAEGLARVEALAAEGDYFKGVEVLEELSDKFDGLETGDTADDMLKAWKKDKEIKAQIQAGEMYAAGVYARSHRDPKTAAAAFAKAIKKAPEGSVIRAQAEAALEALQGGGR